MRRKTVWIAIMVALLFTACAPAAQAPLPPTGAAAEPTPATLPDASASPEQILANSPESSPAEGATVQNITPKQAYQMMRDMKEYVVLDVRTQEEFDQGHIDGALLIPDFELAASADTTLPDKNAVILVYCRSGRRAVGAARTLARAGYTNVYNFGGILDWPYEIVR